MDCRLSLALCWTVVSAGLLSAQTPDPPAVRPTLGFEECGRASAAPECSTSSRAGDRFWVRGEALLGWVRSSALPPLVTTSPPGTPLGQIGVLGTPGASVLVGNESVNGNARAGVRATIGAWLDHDARCGIEVYFLGLDSRNQSFALSSGGSPILARPIIDAGNGQPSSQIVAVSEILAGAVAVSARSGGLVGAGALFRHNLCCTPCTRIDALVGYRYLSYDEELTIQENLTPLVPIIAPGTNVRVFDGFGADNEFHGADLGIEAQRRYGPWSIDLLAKVALGNLRREVRIDGQTAVSSPGAGTVVSTGGLLALSSNIGRYRDDTFTAVPELGLTVGYQLTPRVRLHAGYTILWLPDAARAADQIDLTVNPGLLPPPTGPFEPARPRFELHESHIWLQGISCGLTFQF